MACQSTKYDISGLWLSQSSCGTSTIRDQHLNCEIYRSQNKQVFQEYAWGSFPDVAMCCRKAKMRLFLKSMVGECRKARLMTMLED
ncbi:hypothetical protein PoB_002217000 [Plakobranchus ocellatus]|uniref:Uncharacterized protein n=1 Tax=Plakobranchus ocellatus TaxID=259542 RepID=A0AAV3ZM92_9GAST|nr:hypothetical protein PoB_002217000 [Plakobranchus ocellatus]